MQSSKPEPSFITPKTLPVIMGVFRECGATIPTELAYRLENILECEMLMLKRIIQEHETLLCELNDRRR